MKLKQILLEINQLPDNIIINGVKRSTKNSNGDYISTNIEHIENFYKWFGKSKLVDSMNRPLVVYHGTGDTKFNTFKVSTFGVKMGAGIYFTSIKKDAIQYATRYGGGTILELYLKCEDLAVISNPFTKHELPNSYDSIRAFSGQSGEEILVKNPNQIKAVDNNGNFNDSDDIYN